MSKSQIVKNVFTFILLIASCSPGPQGEKKTSTQFIEISPQGETSAPCVRGGGILELQNSTKLHISSIDFYNPHAQNYDSAPGMYITLDAGTHKYWVRKDWLREYGFQKDGEYLIPHCSLTANCPAGHPSLYVFGYSMNGSRYSNDLDDVVRFTPECPPILALDDGTCKTGSLRVTWVNWGGDSYELAAMAVSFWDYEYAPPGWVYVTPSSGWHKYQYIQARILGQETVSRYGFSQLSGIEVDERYTISREATLTMVNGNNIEVTLVPRERSEGNAEGLVFSIYQSNLGLGDARDEGVLLYIPFSNVRSIQWEIIE